MMNIEFTNKTYYAIAKFNVCIDKGSRLLRHDVVEMGKQLPTFRRMVQPLSGWSNKTTLGKDAANFSLTSLCHGLC
jgi:hypothetical protein